MADNREYLGTDLRLLRNLEFQHDRDRGRDLAVRVRPETSLADLDTYVGADNIAQALLLRFLTHQGEMEVLGHPDFGSRLHELIGEPNTETNRNLAKLYTLQSLQQEPRVEEVLTATVTQRPSDRGAVDIRLRLKIIGEPTPLNLVFPFSFDSGVTA